MAKVANPVKKYNPHPAKVKAAQRALILAEGNSAEASRNSGISPATFKRYLAAGLIDPSIKLDGEDKLAALDNLAADRNTELAASMMDVAEEAINQVSGKLYEASAKDAALIASTMIDKSRLLEGKATQRVEVDVSGSIDVLKRHGILIEEEVIDAEPVLELTE